MRRADAFERDMREIHGDVEIVQVTRHTRASPFGWVALGVGGFMVAVSMVVLIAIYGAITWCTTFLIFCGFDIFLGRGAAWIAGSAWCIMCITLLVAQGVQSFLKH